MSIRLDEFRLETYDERFVLGIALDLYRARYPGLHKEAVEALLTRVSRTQCQPSGCEHCRPDLNPPRYDEED